MIKDFLILNCIGNSDKIGLKFNNKFYIHDSNKNVNSNDQLISSIINLLKRNKVKIKGYFGFVYLSVRPSTGRQHAICEKRVKG